MLALFRNKKAQSTAEYAILIGLVVTAVLGIQLYVKRGTQAQAKDAGDEMVLKIQGGAWGNINSASITAKRQYEHGALASKSTQEVLQDKEDVKLTSGTGEFTKTITQETKQAEGDYQQQLYKGTNEF